MTPDAITAELRSLRGAPDSLRARVRALPEPQPRFTFELPVRRLLLIAAPAVIVVALGAAAVHGLVAGSSSPRPVAEPAVDRGVAGGAVTTPHFGAITAEKRFTPGTVLRSAVGAQPLPPSATRLNRYEAWLRVRVAADELSRDATRAMQIARNAGGYVASVDMNTPGNTGTASLVLKVPNEKVQDVVLQLEKLGTVTAQHVRIQDLERTAHQQEQTVLKLRKTIARLEERLANTNLSPEERLQLQYELQQAKQSLAQATKRHANTVREGTLATISATFFVPQPAAAKPHHRGQLGRTVHSAAGFLVRELAWLLFAVIVFAPIALLAFGLVVALRAGRRRADTRLLEGT